MSQCLQNSNEIKLGLIYYKANGNDIKCLLTWRNLWPFFTLLRFFHEQIIGKKKYE